MVNDSLDGVLILDVTTIPDERGMVIKSQLAPFPVKDVYTTTVRNGAIKAWHGYESKYIMWTVVKGLVKLALFDRRQTSNTFNNIDEFFIGEGNMKSIVVPPGVFNGFKGISTEDAIIVVQASEPYGQIYRLPPDYFPYEWKITNG